MWVQCTCMFANKCQSKGCFWKRSSQVALKSIYFVHVISLDRVRSASDRWKGLGNKIMFAFSAPCKTKSTRVPNACFGVIKVSTRSASDKIANSWPLGWSMFKCRVEVDWCCRFVFVYSRPLSKHLTSSYYTDINAVISHAWPFAAKSLKKTLMSLKSLLHWDDYIQFREFFKFHFIRTSI